MTSGPKNSRRRSSADLLLRRALILAAGGRWGASPNPMVGAVVVQAGEVVGEGWHVRPGEPHAETIALAAAGEAARGATLFVNLEPCAHHGRTPPCTDAVIAAGVARVVACHVDPDPRVRGQGFARLAAAGIEVEVGRQLETAVKLNWQYLVRQVLGRPAVTVKWAMSLDGRIALATGESQWLTAAPARRHALMLREEHDAILVGSGTVLADDPRLTRRLGLVSRSHHRVVLDRRLRLPATARLFTETGPVLVYTETDERERRAAIEAAGGEVVCLPEVTPAAVLADLAARGVASVLVEGGSEVAAAFVAAGCYDRVEALIAPLLLGGREAPGPLGGSGSGSLAGAPRLEATSILKLGPDLLFRGFRPGCLPDLSASLAG
ncbi:MAG TPA: bifunctional diaminohydroxyphosphoribosylaminopyrimidine deaminase/5-amino-6-(5-phosphoribosylamino)uracil reductase RibD [Thermoanaerobaculia bacterium]|nr:bifunctional diaminohydroxyphosphoribosylaminopyrimidine deaminase/5-amino-6-(5-phosphoribosylamino)uracil reductase RibD [Thermoanaerobaculia bacterium]